MTPHPTLRTRLDAIIRRVPDFPKPGIVFRDITPLLGDPATYRETVMAMAAPWREAGLTHVVGIESRGFLFGAPLALALELPFVPVRKPGKLPHRTEREEYALEYGTDALEMHADAMPAGARVLVVDDVLATGGTARATARLVGRVGGTVHGFAFLLELGALGGRVLLGEHRIEALVDA
jgi:adenine phosphoribosyltransferase